MGAVGHSWQDLFASHENHGHRLYIVALKKRSNMPYYENLNNSYKYIILIMILIINNKLI